MRVLFLGDSMVFGEGVEEAERFTNVLEEIEPNWRVDNLGMTGYGRDLVLMALYFGSERNVNRATIDRFLELAELYTVVSAIIFLPGTNDTSADKQQRLWLRKYAERNDTLFLDLSDPIDKAGVKTAFIHRNWRHISNGHRIFALKLRHFLDEAHRRKLNHSS